MADSFPLLTDAEILAARPPREVLDPRRPYAFFNERERNAAGDVATVSTLFLTNRECPFRCLMCDLWKHTLEVSVEPGDIPEQIRFALSQLEPADEIKLYNSGNFFDHKAILVEDYEAVADLVRGFGRVIVENHPKLCGPDVVRFRNLITPATLEVALGLETCHPELLTALNKGMTLADVDRATAFLQREQIAMRAFLLLKPPFLEEEESVEWCLRSIDYALDRGVGCCAVIPTRGGNGIMEQLAADGSFSPPTGASLERVLDECLPESRGRVFVDLWDAERFFPCEACGAARIERLAGMNLSQAPADPVVCEECGT